MSKLTRNNSTYYLNKPQSDSIDRQIDERNEF